MTCLYILSEKSADALAQRAISLVADRYPVQRFGTEAALLEALPRTGQAVVISDLSSEALMAVAKQCRASLAGVSFIAVSASPEPHVALLDSDFLWVSPDFTDFDLLSRIASAVRQAELLATVADSSQLDEVSNLFNRRYMMQRVGEEISLSKRHLSPLCVVILSLDYYRMYLDSYGYSFINALLRFLADKINGMVRHEDIVARLGDDEIAILLPRSTEPGARIFAVRLVESLNQLSFQYGGYVEDIAISAGLVGYPLNDFPHTNADSLIRYGRHALHQAKSDPDNTLKLCLFSEIRPAL